MYETRNLDASQSSPERRGAISGRSRIMAGAWKTNSFLAIAVGVVFLAVESVRYVYLFARADDAKLTQWLPDDAFYYLVLGRNFSLLHRWTLDGVAPATG